MQYTIYQQSVLGGKFMVLEWLFWEKEKTGINWLFYHATYLNYGDRKKSFRFNFDFHVYLLYATLVPSLTFLSRSPYWYSQLSVSLCAGLSLGVLVIQILPSTISHVHCSLSNVHPIGIYVFILDQFYLQFIFWRNVPRSTFSSDYCTFYADLFRRKSRHYLKNCPSIQKEVFYKTKKPHLCVEINRIFLQGMSSLYPYQALLAAGLRGVFDWLFMRLELKISQKGNRLKQSKCDSHHFLLWVLKHGLSSH